MDSEAVAMMVTLPVVFGVFGWSFKALLNFLQQRRLWKHLFDLQNKVLDKYGSSPEALQYLESDVGKVLLERASTEPQNPRAKVLGAVQMGTVLSALSIGFLVTRNLVPEGVEGFTVVGVLGLCLGLGYLLSAIVAYYLSKSWGVFNGSNSSSNS